MRAGKASLPDLIHESCPFHFMFVQEGKRMLQAGGEAVDVAERVTCLLEDCPYFNAGKGSVFTNAGAHPRDHAHADMSKVWGLVLDHASLLL